MKREIKLPFNITSSTPGISAGSDKPVCGICKRSFSNYTCPKCNLTYCSLNCYRAETHSQCTEPFYKREVEDEIKSAPSASGEEKRKMMEMLKRFEEEQAVEEEGDGDSDTEDDLARRLEDIDLETADPDEILALLSESQRSAFLAAVQDPTGEQAQALLAENEVLLPWWDVPETRVAGKRYGSVPSMMQLPQSLLDKPPSTGGRSFLHNVFVLSIVYAWTTRTLGCSPLSSAGKQDAQLAREMIGRVAPFLVDPKSTTVFTSVDGGWTDVISRLDDVSPALQRVLLCDAEILLRPSLVSDAATSNPLDGSPSRRILLALADLAKLFSKPVSHKLAFYAAHVWASRPSDWELILAVVRKKRGEVAKDEPDPVLAVDRASSTARIEELPGVRIVFQIFNQLEICVPASMARIKWNALVPSRCQAVPEADQPSVPKLSEPTTADVSISLDPGPPMDLDEAGTLSENERLWVSRYEALKALGYQLRPRYRPGWVRSWCANPNAPEGNAEDAIPCQHKHAIDARRVTDGAPVSLKVVLQDSSELKIQQYLFSEALKQESKKHVAPLLDILDDPLATSQVILVHPYLRHINYPPLASIREAMDFVQQSLEALVFLHTHRITHGNLTLLNVMMDARALYPEGWHPQSEREKADASASLETRSRTSVGGVKYYMINFDRGTLHPETVDEQKEKADIHTLGSSLFSSLTPKYKNLFWIRPLFLGMIDTDPNARPTAADAFNQFKALRKSHDTGLFSSRLRLTAENESSTRRLLRDAAYRAQEVVWAATPKSNLPPWS